MKSKWKRFALVVASMMLFCLALTGCGGGGGTGGTGGGGSGGGGTGTGGAQDDEYNYDVNDEGTLIVVSSKENGTVVGSIEIGTDEEGNETLTKVNAVEVNKITSGACVLVKEVVTKDKDIVNTVTKVARTYAISRAKFEENGLSFLLDLKPVEELVSDDDILCVTIIWEYWSGEWNAVSVEYENDVVSYSAYCSSITDGTIDPEFIFVSTGDDLEDDHALKIIANAIFSHTDTLKLLESLADDALVSAEDLIELVDAILADWEASKPDKPVDPVDPTGEGIKWTVTGEDSGKPTEIELTLSGELMASITNGEYTDETALPAKLTYNDDGTIEAVVSLPESGNTASMTFTPQEDGFAVNIQLQDETGADMEFAVEGAVRQSGEAVEMADVTLTRGTEYGPKTNVFEMSYEDGGCASFTMTSDSESGPRMELKVDAEGTVIATTEYKISDTDTITYVENVTDGTITVNGNTMTETATPIGQVSEQTTLTLTVVDEEDPFSWIIAADNGQYAEINDYSTNNPDEQIVTAVNIVTGPEAFLRKVHIKKATDENGELVFSVDDGHGSIEPNGDGTWTITVFPASFQAYIGEDAWGDSCLVVETVYSEGDTDEYPTYIYSEKESIEASADVYLTVADCIYKIFPKIAELFANNAA